VWSGFGVLILSILLLAGLWNAGLRAGRQEVIDQCAIASPAGQHHNRYKLINHETYMNCLVTKQASYIACEEAAGFGPETVPGSTAGKKK
jgi:hypothetical protein